MHATYADQSFTFNGMCGVLNMDDKGDVRRSG